MYNSGLESVDLTFFDCVRICNDVMSHCKQLTTIYGLGRVHDVGLSFNNCKNLSIVHLKALRLRKLSNCFVDCKKIRSIYVEAPRLKILPKLGGYNYKCKYMTYNLYIIYIYIYIYIYL